MLRSDCMLVCDWLEMFGSVKKLISGSSSVLSNPAPSPHRRSPSTPPLPLKTLQLVAKQPETPVELRGRRDRREVRGHLPGVRESWPGARLTTSGFQPRIHSLTSSSRGQPITEAHLRSRNQPQGHVSSSVPPLTLPASPHCSLPVKALPGGRGSDATMMSLLLFCHSSSTSLIAIDNKIEQAMDLVKSHLMLAVREEVELLREQIRELQEKNQQLERENHILRTLTHTIRKTHNT